MNIFYTNKDPRTSAEELCNVHLREKIPHYAMLLSSAHRKLDGFGPLWVKHDGNDRKWWVHHTDTLDESGKKLRLTGYILLAGVNLEHPCVNWLCESTANYTWLFLCFIRACTLYERQHGEKHEYHNLQNVLMTAPDKLSCEDFTAPMRFVMPEFRHIQDPCKAYQAHVNHKLSLLKNVEFNSIIPDWLTHKPEKSITQLNREKKTGRDEGPPLGTPPQIITAANTVVGVKEDNVGMKRGGTLNSYGASAPNIVHAIDAETHNNEIRKAPPKFNPPPKFKVPPK